jgi:hypothetical protein
LESFISPSEVIAPRFKVRARTAQRGLGSYPVGLFSFVSLCLCGKKAIGLSGYAPRNDMEATTA